MIRKLAWYIRRMRIEGLRKYRNRPSIDDLPEPLRSAARDWYARLVHNRMALGKPTPQTTLALLAGQAKRLALNPPTSAWGRSVRAKRGGYAVQRRYRAEGRVGRLHPAHLAAAVSASRRKWRKKSQRDEQERQRLCLPRSRRSRWTLTC